MNKTRSLCEHCIFAIRKDFRQTGCKLGRLDKFEKEMVGLSYELEGVCNRLRNIYWEPYVKFKKINKPLLTELAKEIEIKYSLLVSYDGNDDKLTKTIESAKGEFSPVDIVICIDRDLTISPLTVYDKFKKLFFPLFVAQSLDENVFKSGINKTQGKFILFLDGGSLIDKSAFSYLNSQINDEMRQLYMMVGSDFTLCYKKLYESVPEQSRPMEALYQSLINSPKLKDTVVKWPLE